MKIPGINNPQQFEISPQVTAPSVPTAQPTSAPRARVNGTFQSMAQASSGSNLSGLRASALSHPDKAVQSEQLIKRYIAQTTASLVSKSPEKKGNINALTVDVQASCIMNLPDGPLGLAYTGSLGLKTLANSDFVKNVILQTLNS